MHSNLNDKNKSASQKMPKQRVLALANMLKRGLAIASIMSFGTFGGLVAFHQIGTSTQTSSATSQTKSTTSSSSKNNNSFLKQQGANTSGTSAATDTSTSGSNAASSTAVTGTHTS